MKSRDTTNWYLDLDPMQVVSDDLIRFVTGHAGRKILDLGCGTGGYSRRLADLGYATVAADIVSQYVEVARGLGLEAVVLEPGRPLPFPEDSFDTVVMLEVLEHLEDPKFLLTEARRVARQNLLVTVPNCTMRDSLAGAGLFFEHELDQDHRNYFTRDSLRDLLLQFFPEVRVEEQEFMDEQLYAILLPAKPLGKVKKLLDKGKMEPRLSFRLYAEARLQKPG